MKTDHRMKPYRSRIRGLGLAILLRSSFSVIRIFLDFLQEIISSVNVYVYLRIRNFDRKIRLASNHGKELAFMVCTGNTKSIIKVLRQMGSKKIIPISNMYRECKECKKSWKHENDKSL